MYPVVRVGFEETSLTVSESQESVEICVNSTSPGIEETFTVNITSDDNGMCTLIVIIVFLLYDYYFTDCFQPVHQFEVDINSSNLSDYQCHNFPSSDVCSCFTECNDIYIELKLNLTDRKRSVLLPDDSSALDVVVQCSCSASTSLGDAGIAAVTLGVLVALTLLATCFLLFTFFYRERRKKS